MWRSTTVSGTSLLRSQCSNAYLPPPYGGTAMRILQVELWTQPQHRMYTSVKRATRSPSWRGQRLEVLVQEPGSQQLQVVLHDVDVLNVKVTPMHMMTWHMTCASQHLCSAYCTGFCWTLVTNAPSCAVALALIMHTAGVVAHQSPQRRRQADAHHQDHRPNSCSTALSLCTAVYAARNRA